MLSDDNINIVGRCKYFCRFSDNIFPFTYWMDSVCTGLLK